MSTILLYYDAEWSFMTETISKAKAVLESILQNHSQWHTDRESTTWTKMVNSIEEVETLSAKIDAMMSMMSKPNLDNVAL
jgi:hypothetical protein